jgi:tRNA(fMet)-specific endonuclease VapC
VKYLLDTDHLSIIQKSTGQDYQFLSARMEQIPISDFAVSVVTVHEQFLGSSTYISRARNSADIVRGYKFMEKLVWSFRTIPVLGFDDRAAAIFSSIQLQRVKVATMDLRIASIAIAHELTLLTRNDRDFMKIPGLVTANWTIS